MPFGAPMETCLGASSPPLDKTAADNDFAVVLARFACGLRFDHLPAAAVAAVQANILDTLTCAAAGSSAAGVADLRALALEWGGTGQASVLCFGDKVPAHHAAWVNGAMAHARDYDDTHDAAVLHAGVSVVPAALAAAELRGGVSGADFIAAVAAGLETICRLGVATQVSIIETGYMYTSLFGHFAATVAAGRLLGLDAQQMVNALGIAYSQVAGNHQVTRDGALTKRMQPGFAAQAALVSVQMAQRGIRGAQATFEGLDGFLRVYLHDRVDRAALREGLGQRWELTQLSYKPYPCCRLNHSGIDAALALRAAHGLRADRICRVRVGVNRQSFQAVCTPIEIRRQPQTIVHAQFSLPYTVACVFLDGGVRLGHFEQASITRPDLVALAHRVEPYVDERIERDWGRSVSPALMQVEMDDGSVHRLQIDLPLGHPNRPMTEAAVEAKAVDCFQAAAVALPPAAAGRLRQAVAALPAGADTCALVHVLMAAA